MNNEDDGEETGRYPIPQELLVTMPIAHVDANTKIIPIVRPTQAKQIESAQGNKEGLVQRPKPPPAQAGPSGEVVKEVQETPMEVEDGCTTVPVVPAPLMAPAQRDKNPEDVRSQPKTQILPKTGVPPRPHHKGEVGLLGKTHKIYLILENRGEFILQCGQKS